MKKFIMFTTSVLLACPSLLQAQFDEDKMPTVQQEESPSKPEKKTPLRTLEQRKKDFQDKLLYGRSLLTQHVTQEHGYKVESGLYADKNRNNDEGSAVMVTSPTGELTAILDFPDKKGILTIDREGEEKFIEEPKDGRKLEHDTVIEEAKKVEKQTHKTPNTARGETQKIDFLAGYSLSALSTLNVDPVAYAIAQLETARQGLRNSKIPGVELRLGGLILINEKDGTHNTTTDGLANWQRTFEEYRNLYKTDINMAIAEPGDAGGWAYVGGYTSVNSKKSPAAFRHELGHNVGGNHCNDNGTNNYKFGYNNGNSRTFLCGNSSPYYSNPDITDNNGLPFGDKKTANMARLWKEQTSRMANYNPELAGLKLFFVSQDFEGKTADFEIPLAKNNKNSGSITLVPNTGKKDLESAIKGDYTLVAANLKHYEKNKMSTVNLRAQKKIGSCPFGPINQDAECEEEEDGPLVLRLSYNVSDNQTLENGTYNGLLTLNMKGQAKLELPINTIISLQHHAPTATPPFDENDAVVKTLTLSADKPASLNWTYEGKDTLGQVTFYSAQGPMELVWAESGATKVPVFLRNEKDDSLQKVILRVTRKTACSTRSMNSSVACGTSNKYTRFEVTFDPDDNPHIAGGKFNGFLPLKMKDWYGEIEKNVLYRISLSSGNDSDSAIERPVAVVGHDFTVTAKPDASSAHDLDGSASQNAVSYKWSIVKGAGTFWLQEKQGSEWVKQVNNAKARALIPANTTGEATYLLTVTGKDGKTDESKINVTVNKAGSSLPPVANAGKDLAVTGSTVSSQAYELDGSASQNAVSYKWSIVKGAGTFWLQEKQGSGWVKEVNNVKARALIPANATGEATYLLTVTGKDGKTDESRITVQVKQKEPEAPSAPEDAQIADWSASKTYSQPCEKVKFNNKIWTNGWWSKGDVPTDSGQWGVWREVNSVNRHTSCK